MAPGALFFLVSLLSCIPGADEGAGPVELGAVAWERDHDAAFARARSSGRPLLLLFQEIPG
jgi:hypothetical protein